MGVPRYPLGVTFLHDTDDLERFAREFRVPPHHLHRLATLVLKRGFEPSVALAELPVPLPAELVERLRFESLLLEKRVDSAGDGATRLLFRTAAGAPVESVLLRIASGRTTLCLSCQSGCAVRCRFCATGREGLRAELTAPELLDQLVQAGRIAAAEGRKVRNLVFMGMGEPLLVESTLYEALDRLVHPCAFAFPATRIAVSTVGLPGAMIRLAGRFPEVRLALSLHSARAEVREALIPAAAEHSLEELRAAVLEIGRSRSAPVMIEYLLLEGWTDRPEDLAALAAWLDGLRVRLNLIPYNFRGENDPLKPTSRDDRDRIAAYFRSLGFQCTVRRSLGGDSGAACGQLAGEAP